MREASVGMCMRWVNKNAVHHPMRSRHFTASASIAFSAWPSTLSPSSKQNVRRKGSGVAPSVSLVFREWELAELASDPKFMASHDQFSTSGARANETHA